MVKLWRCRKSIWRCRKNHSKFHAWVEESQREKGVLEISHRLEMRGLLIVYKWVQTSPYKWVL